MTRNLPIARPVLFPLFGITLDGKCACGVEGCGRVGKHPRLAWGAVEYGTPVPRAEPGAGYGLKTGAGPQGSGIFVVDLDSLEALDAFNDLGACSDTFIVSTPRGYHLYFTHPGFHVKNSAGDLSKGIDIRGDGGFVVAPGSPHRSGGRYGTAHDAPIAPAPAWLLEWLQRQPKPSEAQHYPGDVEGAELAYHRKLYTQYLSEEAVPRGPEHRGQGDGILFNVVQRGAYDLALPVDDVLELVREHYDPRCSPPWGDELEERVRHKARCAKGESTRPRIIPLPEDLLFRAGIDGGGQTPVHERKERSKGWEALRWGGWNTKLDDPVYLLEGLIPEGKVCTFFAEGGSVKSWSLFSLCIAVATGGTWLGKAVQQGPALIVDYEDGPYEFQRRMRILRQSNLEDIENLGYVYSPGGLHRPEFWQELTRRVLERQVKLIAIDSLGAGMPGDADENVTAFAASVKAAGEFTEAVAETGCAVVIIHHANRNGGIRGSSAIRDQSDVVFKFEPVSETDDVKRMRMICDKPGPQKKPKPLNVELSDAGLTTFEDESAEQARNAIKGEDLKPALLLALEQNGPMVATALHELFKDSAGEHAVDKALKALKQMGKVVKPGHFAGWQLDDDTRRRARVVAAARIAKGTTDLADRAHVPVECVQAAIDDQAITLRTGREGGGFIIA